MLKNEELRQAVISQIVYHNKTFSEEIAEALREDRRRIAQVMKGLANDGYCSIYEGIFSHSQIHFVQHEDMKKLLVKINQD
jgi:hypothetical protein